MKYWLIICIFLAPGTLLAQKVKLVNSTQQNWSGGIAGRRGAHYTFALAFSDIKKDPQPDSLWIGDDLVPLSVANTSIKRSKRSVVVSIRAETYRDDHPAPYPDPTGEHQAKKPPPPPKYNGVALLSYTCEGKKHYYAITKIIDTYPPASYP